MPEAHFTLDTNNSPPSRELKDNGFVQLLRAWNIICDHRKAMIESRDADSNPDVAADFATMNGIYKFLAAPGGATSDAKALAGFLEIDSAHAACDAAIRQLCARFK